MGRMKEYLTDLGVALHNGNLDMVTNEVRDSATEPSWVLSQLCALRTGIDSDGMFMDRDEPELTDGFFIGGEGSPEYGLAICYDCFWFLRPVMDWQKDSEVGWMKVSSPILDDSIRFHRYDPYDGEIHYDPIQCNCGNFIRTKIGHDALFAAVARKEMSPQIAVQLVNMQLSHDHDPRAFLYENSGMSQDEWDD